MGDNVIVMAGGEQDGGDSDALGPHVSATSAHKHTNLLSLSLSLCTFGPTSISLFQCC